jgi:uncharacterized protein YkwD
MPGASATPDGTSTPTPGPGTPTATATAADSTAESTATPGGAATNTTPTPAPSAVAAAVAPPTLQATTQAPPTEFSAQVVNLVNEYRAKNGLGRLRADPYITTAALNYARVMGTTRGSSTTIEHTGPDGSTPSSRVKATSYAGCFAGENLSAGQTSALDAVNAWKSSPDHNEILLTPNATDIGVGYFYAPDSYFKHYWVLDIGGPPTSFKC